MRYSVDSVRARFPALGREEGGWPVAYLDGPGGSQVVDGAIDAMANYLRSGSANLHGVFGTSVETDAMIFRARRAMADLLGGEADEIAFGANMTSLCFSISRAMAVEWGPGDEVIVTELDHRANVDPWILAARDRGATVRFAKVDPETLTLDLPHLHSLIGARTKVVALGRASNVVGTVTDVRPIADMAHMVGAKVVVDAVHAVPHLFTDRDELGADVLFCSLYKCFGPHVGVASIKGSLLSELQPYKVLPQIDVGSERVETGTQNHEGLAAVESVVDFIAALGSGDTRREQIRSAFERIQLWEDGLAALARQRLLDIPWVRIYGAPDHVMKTPTIAFRVQGFTPREVCLSALRQGIYIADGDFYATTLAQRLGIHSLGSWARAGLAPYTTEEEVQRLVQAIEDLAT